MTIKKNKIFYDGLVFQLAKVKYENEERHSTEPKKKSERKIKEEKRRDKLYDPDN